MREMPLLLRIICILIFLCGLACAGLACIALFAGSPDPKNPAANPGLPPILGGILLGVAIFSFIYAMGLWIGAKWAWWLNCISSICQLVAVFFLVWKTFGYESTDPLYARIKLQLYFSFAIQGGLFLYFLSQDVLDYFELKRSKMFYVLILLLCGTPCFIYGVTVIVPQPAKDTFDPSKNSWMQGSGTPSPSTPGAKGTSPNGTPPPDTGISGLSETVTCLREVPAYSVTDPSKKIGVFHKGSTLEILETIDDSNLKVRYQLPGDKTMDAICHSSDLDLTR